MRKVLSVLLSVMLLICLCPNVFALENASLVVSGDNSGSIERGSSLNLTVTVPAITEFAGMAVKVEFDNSILEVTSLNIPTTLNGKTATVSSVESANEKGVISFVVGEASNFDMNDSLVITAVFKVAENAELGLKNNLIKIKEYDVTDENDNEVTKPVFNIESISLTITAPHVHRWSNDWTSDGTHHWHECAEGCDITDNAQKDGYAAHSGGTATCTTQATCEVCHQLYGNLAEHSFTKQVENDTYYVAGTGADCQHAKKYYYACANCDAKGTDTWTSTTKGPHSFDTTAWDYKDSDGHAHKCTVSGCTEHGTVTAHTPGAAATETTPQTCTECSYVIAPATGHIRHTLTNHPANPATCTEAGNIEYWTCSGCNDKFSDADGTNKITGSVTIAALGHDHNGPWVTTDENEHWKVCAREGCNEQLDKAVHTPSAWVNVGDGYHHQTCTVCERELTHEVCTFGQPLKYNATSHWEECTRCGNKQNEAAHEFLPDSDKCTSCDYTKSSTITIITPTQPGDSKPAEGNPSTGAVSSPVGYVMIGLAAVGALCLGAKKLTKKHED